MSDRPVAWLFQRRLLLLAVTAVVLLIAAGMIGGVVVNDRRHHRPAGEATHGGRPWLFVLLVLVLAMVVLAAWLWRRVSRPMGELLAAASRVGAGPPTVPAVPVAVPHAAPRELRDLIGTFNEMTMRLERTDHERRRFLADVTHELRTPLTVLRSGIEAQLDGVHPRDDEHLAALADETTILSRVIDDLHTLALTEAGQLTLYRTPVDPAALVHDAVAAFVAAAEVKQITLSVGFTTDVVRMVDVDAGRIRQVLGNLLANAVRHAPVGGRVNVTVDSTSPGVVRIEVIDDGPGIAAEDLADVFTRYRKAADSGGSGLGLTIARDLVHAHGGTISARNNDGAGATISMTLPTVS
jgi:two-component system sensor histidine kinase BaeS